MKKQEQNKKKKRKILLSLIMILFVGVILTASTYTWFTANQTVSVQDIDVNVSTSTGLQISVDAKDWKTIVTTDDINTAKGTYPTAVNQMPTKDMEPVSTAGEVEDSGPNQGFMKMFKGTLAAPDEDSDLELTALQELEVHGTEGNFIAFDLFFQTNAEMPIQLTSNSTVLAGQTDTAIENAARVAFLPQGHVEAGNPDGAQALKATDNTGLKIWEPNYDVHTASGVQNAALYGVSTTQTGGSQLKYYGIKADIADGVDPYKNFDQPPTNANFTDMSGSGFMIYSPATGIPTTAYLNVFTLEPGITKVRIYMWVEGQDVDCENNASGGDISFNLQFSSLTASA